MARLDAMGPRRAQMAVTRGQHTHPDGMYFGGSAPTWSAQVFREVLRRHAGACQRLAWIDLHTGLGPSGVGERIFAAFDAAAVPRARRWWGDGVTSVETGSSTSIPMTGPIQWAVQQECPQAEYTGIALEFGTLPLVRMIRTLRADQWYENHPEADRAALLCVQDKQVAIRSFMKLAGGANKLFHEMDQDEFMRQIRAYEEADESSLNKIYKFFITAFRTHPFPIMRAKHLDEWITSGEFQRISGIDPSDP